MLSVPTESNWHNLTEPMHTQGVYWRHGVFFVSLGSAVSVLFKQSFLDGGCAFLKKNTQIDGKIFSPKSDLIG